MIDIKFNFICLMSFKSSHTKLNIFGNESNQLSIASLIKTCDCLDNLNISIYLLETEKFIYNNSALNRVIGDYSTKILNKNWDSWFDFIRKDELLSVKKKIENFSLKPYVKTPYVLRYHIINENGENVLLRHELLLHYLGENRLIISYFYDITERERIENYFKAVNSDMQGYHEKLNLISPREKEVLKLIADGFSSKQIADILFISNHTAISHRKNLIEKFKVKNTAQLIKRASRSIELW
ncbi:helix-turn-helix transcriptional regulator [Tamlana agarivorans]|uniref:Helix-turn-helix transcriptional regulator n=1 Tax=Pseudotamlana agarivorans TaxID=481183 RepID=A0ACC5U7F9_9FLAO|nr:helix-turn-helix transcriptional regulator [Tamlana agarivorans]MBU2950198.1 helix-turn-helix transcriptional regulator [Tamlana agarivorans]